MKILSKEVISGANKLFKFKSIFDTPIITNFVPNLKPLTANIKYICANWKEFQSWLK